MVLWELAPLRLGIQQGGSSVPFGVHARRMLHRISRFGGAGARTAPVQAETATAEDALVAILAWWHWTAQTPPFLCS